MVVILSIFLVSLYTRGICFGLTFRSATSSSYPNHSTVTNVTSQSEHCHIHIVLVLRTMDADIETTASCMEGISSPAEGREER